MWRKASREISSKGSVAPKAKDLAGLHERKRLTDAQHFTPEWISEGIWQSLSKYVDQAAADKVFLSAFDSSIGSGALFDAAPTKGLRIYGLDTDHDCVKALTEDAIAADIDHEITPGSLTELEAEKFHLSLINPPFSISLNSPNLFPFDCTTFGKYGAGTSAKSHEYSLALSLDAARVVVALLPVTMDKTCRAYPGLRMVVRLPNSTFIDEGANVATAVYFFEKGSTTPPVSVSRLDGENDWPVIEPRMPFKQMNPHWEINGVTLGKPTITLPVTGDNTVELHHHNRNIVLKYHCGLTQAKVANALLRHSAVGEKLPSTIQYAGEGQLMLDTLLLKSNPGIQLKLLAKEIEKFGGKAVITKQLQGYYNKLVKRHKRTMVPMYRTVKVAGNTKSTITSKRRQLLEPGNFSGPGLAKGQKVSAELIGGEYEISHEGTTARLTRHELTTRFDFNDDEINSGGEWTNIHKGLPAAYPELAHQWGVELDKAGIDWLADFQRFSVIEGLINRYGFIGGWEQGTGKARSAIALGLMHSGRSLLIVESGLLPEMLIELTQKIKLDKSRYQVLTPTCDPGKDVGLYITTYATLRSKFREGKGPAKRWRRLFNTVICDEGGLLCNLHTLQTRAVKTLCARKLICFDGTPLRNYPRDLLPLSVATAGNGLAHQPYGVKGKPYMDKVLAKTTSHSQKGEDRFVDKHVEFQWVTYTFEDELQKGGKREVPRLRNPELFRSWAAVNLQRRLVSEPDLAEFGSCPTPVRNIESVQWDDEHFAHYLVVATEFAEWFKKTKADTSKKINLVTVLARLAAVQRAANSPHVESEKCNFKTYLPVTAKQRHTVDKTLKHVKAGRKVIVYAKSPDVLNRLSQLLSKRDCKSVLFTGKQDINRRTDEMNSEFRYGDTMVLLSSWVGQRGLNLPQGKAVIFYERDWSSTTEEQAIARTQRPDQEDVVQVTYLETEGSIDTYMRQLVTWKKQAADCGLDWGEGADEDEEFLHLDKLLHQFCEDTLQMTINEAKEHLVA